MAELQLLSSSNVEFGLDLYNKISASEPDSNLFYSPISISIALAMTYLGANGQTEAEMKSALKFDKVPGDKLHLLFKELNDHLLDTKGSYKLHVANKLFGDKSFSFLKDFLENCKRFYGAELEQVDFTHNASRCESIINDWVEQRTNNKIKKLIPPGVLNELTRLVLVNAVYFKEDWNDKFQANNTKDEDFFITKDNKIKVPLMHFDKKKLNYYFDDELNCQILELSYVNRFLSFIVILPDLSKTTLSDVEKKLTSSTLVNISQYLRQKDIQLWLPKFKLESSFEVDEKLKELGIMDLFVNGKADLSKMDGTKELYVSKVLHKAFIEVNEEGSEAAATNSVMKRTFCGSIASEPVSFRADHPFIFFIKENKTGVILFMGKLVNP